MAKYLDEQGLKTLWDKIKERDGNTYSNAITEVNKIDKKITDEIKNREAAITTLSESKLDVSLRGQKNGVASLTTNGKVPLDQLPSYVDDVIEGYYKNVADVSNGFYEDEGCNHPLADCKQAGKIYVDRLTNKTYRWSGRAYVEISASLALGETSSTAYAGDKGKANADAINSLNTRVGNVEGKFGNYVKTSTFMDVLGNKVSTSTSFGDNTRNVIDVTKSAKAGYGVKLAVIDDESINGTVSSPMSQIELKDGLIDFTVMSRAHNQPNKTHTLRISTSRGLEYDGFPIAQALSTAELDAILI